MKDQLEIIRKWQKRDHSMAMARVIQTWGSSPRPIGSTMVINSEQQMSGSVSGGCVEGAVSKKATELIGSGLASRLSYGVSDEDAWSFGLSCGGSIGVFLQSIDASDIVWSALFNNIENNKSSILISSLEDGASSNALVGESGKFIGDGIPDKLLTIARDAYDERTHKTVDFGDKEYFIHLFPRNPILLIIGAAHITVDLVALGNQFGFDTIVIDPRGYFAQNTVFSDPPSKMFETYPSEVLGELPLDAYTFCAILSHDPKIDDNALEILLRSKVGYIGALGSRKTHAKRTKRLLEKGVEQALIARIKAPIGVSIHAKSAREIALSIMSEIIQTKNEFVTR